MDLQWKICKKVLKKMKMMNRRDFLLGTISAGSAAALTLYGVNFKDAEQIVSFPDSLKASVEKLIFETSMFEYNTSEHRKNVTSEIMKISEPYKSKTLDYFVVCDGTNNTPEIISNNGFRANLICKNSSTNTHSILDIEIQRTGVMFEDIESIAS